MTNMSFKRSNISRGEQTERTYQSDHRELHLSSREVASEKYLQHRRREETTVSSLRSATIHLCDGALQTPDERALLVSKVYDQI